MSRALVVGWCLAASAAHAYPIPAQTLWEVTKQAELVVLAWVQEVRSEAQSEQFGLDQDVAVLRPRSTWKGAHLDNVEVRFTANLTCPAPARYLPGRLVVAFLHREGPKGEWRTVALSYGTRYPARQPELEALHAVVAKAQALQRTWAWQAPPTEWALAAYAHPATRWDGLFSLDPDVDAPRAGYAHRAPAAALAPEVLAWVEAAFLLRPSFDATVLQTLRLLEGRGHDDVTRVMADVLESVMVNQVSPRWASEAMTLLEARLTGKPAARRAPAAPRGSAEAEWAVAEAARGGWGSEDVDQARWEALKQRHRLSPKVRPDFERVEPSRTGGDSPL